MEQNEEASSSASNAEPVLSDDPAVNQAIAYLEETVRQTIRVGSDGLP